MKVFSILFLSILPLFSKVQLTQEQVDNLNIVRDIANKYKDDKGETFPNTLAAICMTESSGGVHLMGDLDKKNGKIYLSLGAMQIRVPTARYISSIYPKEFRQIHAMTDRDLRKILIEDIRFSAKIAALYIVHLSNTRKSYLKTVSGYNGGSYNYKYFNRVMEWNKKLRALGINF